MLALIPWVAIHGPSPRFVAAQLFTNRISTFFALDLLLTGCVLAIYARSALTSVRQRWIVILVMLCAGVSAALPLLLYLREMQRQAEATAI
jgi:hypothetical protein